MKHRKSNKMRKQKTMFQMKEYDKTPRKPNATKISNLPDKAFKVKVIQMLTELRKKVEEQ